MRQNSYSGQTKWTALLIVIQDRQNELRAMLKWQWNPLEDKLEGIIQINSQVKTKHNNGALRSKGTFEPLCLYQQRELTMLSWGDRHNKGCNTETPFAWHARFKIHIRQTPLRSYPQSTASSTTSSWGKLPRGFHCVPLLFATHRNKLSQQTLSNKDASYSFTNYR